MYGLQERGITMTTKTLKRRDDNVRDHVLFELKSDPRITSSDIAAAVKDGVVTLSGFVTSYWEKDAAEKAAKRVYGVKGVANDIEVKPSSIQTDPEIARDVVHELERHISIPSDRIKVTVKNGWVTLEGSIGVEWQYQKILAESAVKKLRGVTGITNDVEVKPRKFLHKRQGARSRKRCVEAPRLMRVVFVWRLRAAQSRSMAACAHGPRRKMPNGRHGLHLEPLRLKAISR